MKLVYGCVAVLLLVCLSVGVVRVGDSEALGLRGVFAGERPNTLGVHEGRLAACPETPNCVVSQQDVADAAHEIAPIQYEGEQAQARDILLKILRNQPRVVVVADEADYVAVEFTSQWMGFVDDAEFYFPEGQGVIEVRSAARLGESDLGVNRRRIEQIRLAMKDLGA
jgi:uncharacterized protein (DUF1499 family)